MAKTWQIVLATVAIFVAGLVTGGATTLGVVRWIGARRAQARQAMLGQSPQRGGPLGTPFGPQLLRSFASQLDLSADQRARIEPIVKRTSFELGQQRREVQLKSALIIERMQDDISQLLTPDQRAKFEDLVSQQRERLRRLRAGQPPAAAPN